MRERFAYATCEHYRGMSSPCAKGVTLDQVIDVHGRVPCCVIRGITGDVACDMRSIPEADTSRETGPARIQLDRLLDGKCPKCGTAIAGEMEFNESILALPCRHVIRGGRD